MNPNAGDVQAPPAAATPAAKKVHVYREEWEMDEGAYGRKGTPRVKPYSMCSLFILFICFFYCLGLFPEAIGKKERKTPAFSLFI